MKKLKSGILLPAYGRDYKSPNQVKKAFLNGKDFTLRTFDQRDVYCSIRDFEMGAIVELRYKNLSCVTTLKLGD